MLDYVLPDLVSVYFSDNCGASKTKRLIGIILSVVCLSSCHALLLLGPHAFNGILVIISVKMKSKNQP